MYLVKYCGKPIFVGQDDMILVKIADFLGYESNDKLFPPNCNIDILSLLKDIINLAPSDKHVTAKIIAIKVLRHLNMDQDNYHLGLQEAKKIVDFCALASFNYIGEKV